MADIWSDVTAQISQVTGQAFRGKQTRSVGGGCINQAYGLSDGQMTFFVKLNQASKLAMFEAELAGLQEIHSSQTIRVPLPVCTGLSGANSYIVMEWLDFGGRGHAWAAMGRDLAAMHRTSSDLGFGWHRANTIGETHQPNDWQESWYAFWRDQRLGYQFRLAKRRGGSFPQQQALMDALPELLSEHDPMPSLVHGDLWSGNASITTVGEPVIFDPATYYGDREVDLAMTELFGSFPTDFYSAYEAAYPLSEGYATRKILYNLYHILNHFNLFGGGYESQANRMIQQLLVKVR
ncbi:fructosamine kinase family protein [Leptothoe spongobia]|uniref:Fructosamine kinase family protein n=1 Tax=Leptothoe spongobia TAU-MAC 1115 TaxID=1967444 RepID=A0A947DDD4_9CYAN|nr:fructosamine kinase family protein [Leptothoe spongobia]MBT9314948.1 fructosamine kinase family protein [Leptothoe spongobia TAU-MAC 1115]